MDPVKKIIGQYDDEVSKQVRDVRDRGIPKFDGSGRGVGANVGRGGCVTPINRGRKSFRGRGRRYISEDIVDNII